MIQTNFISAIFTNGNYPNLLKLIVVAPESFATFIASTTSFVHPEYDIPKATSHFFNLPQRSIEYVYLDMLNMVCLFLKF